jgi:hypothetical protein
MWLAVHQFCTKPVSECKRRRSSLEVMRQEVITSQRKDENMNVQVYIVNVHVEQKRFQNITCRQRNEGRRKKKTQEKRT